jgi:hypothetical protein
VCSGSGCWLNGRKDTDGGASVDEEGEVVGRIVYVQQTTGVLARDAGRRQRLACEFG